MARQKEPYVISVDWLELYCHINTTLEIGEHIVGNFKLEVANKHTRFYSKLAIVSIPTSAGSYVEFAEILLEPNSKVLDPRSAHIRVLNEQLYTCAWFTNLSQVLKTLGLQYRSVKRVDLAYDCNKFAKGTDPQNLLKGYFLQKILKIGTNRCTMQIANMGYNLETVGEEWERPRNLPRPAVTGVTWGSMATGKQHVIYNKSLEMREVKFKPWIVERWLQHGLDPEKVWRAEIRICNRGKEMMFGDPEHLFSLGMSEIADQDRIEELFLSYANQLYRFVKNDGRVRKQRMESIKLFEISPATEISIAPRTHRVKQALGRTVKVVKNVLCTWYSWVKNKLIDVRDIHIEESLDAVVRFADSIIPRIHQVDHDPTMPDYFRDLTMMMIEKGDFDMFKKQDIFDTFEGTALRHKFEAHYDASSLVKNNPVFNPAQRKRAVISDDFLLRQGWQPQGLGVYLHRTGKVRYNMATREVSTIQQVEGQPSFVPSAFHPYYCDELVRFTNVK